MSAVATRICEVQLESFDPRAPIMGLSSQPLVSFVEALDPLPLDEKELIKAASSVYCHEGGRLSVDEKQAIYAYSCEGGTQESSLYCNLNGGLRNRDRSKVRPYMAFIKLFNTGLKKCMVKIVQSLWRGVALDLYEAYVSQIGKTIVFWGYTSATIDMKALDQFIPIDAPHRTLFSIRVEAAADIREYSAYSEEQEMLIMAGTVFKVLNVHRTAKNLTIVELEGVANLLDPEAATVEVSLPTAMAKLELSAEPVAGGTSDTAAFDGQTMYKEDNDLVRAVARAYEEGLRHEEDTNIHANKRARECYEAAAFFGHARARSKVGCFYYNGWGGLVKDEFEALQHYQMGADQGDALGQFCVGTYYMRGLSWKIKRDVVEAVRWFRLATDQGHAEAQYTLGMCYEEGGKGVGKDVVEAVRWYRLAADQGYAQAQCALGICYEKGEGGLAKDAVEAVRWYYLAAVQDNRTALLALEGLARQKHTAALFNLGLYHEKGTKRCPYTNIKEAAHWYRLAAEQGNDMAHQHLRLAADQGHAEAQFNLGLYFENGKRDVAKAIKWYRRAADQKLSTAERHLRQLLHTEL